MVQRLMPQGKPRRAAKVSADTVNKVSSSDPGDDASSTARVAHVPQILQERWRECKIADGYWLSRSAGSGKICIASEADPQPKEVNIVELLRKLRVNVDELSRKLEVNVDELIPKLGEEPKKQISDVGPSSKKRRVSSVSPSSSPQSKRRIPNGAKTPETDEDDDYVSDADDELDGVLDGEEGEEYHTQAIKIRDLLEWYTTALKMMGQLACKDIGKIWIKACHPKKQTTHPYNGGATNKKSLRLYGFGGALTKPDWWPPMVGWEEGKGCRHQEPDHIKKPERLILLTHILRCGDPQFTIDKLERATAQLEREIPKHFTTKSIKILKQIYYARRQEIRCQDGGIDPESTVNLYVPKPPAKAPKVAKSVSAVAIKEEPSPRVTKDRRPAKVTDKETDSQASIEEKQRVLGQMDFESTDETEPTGLRSTPSSSVTMTPSTAGSERFSTESIQRPAQTLKGVTPKIGSPPVPIQGQCGRQAPTSRTNKASLATTTQFGGLPVERMQEPARKRASITHTKPSSKPLSMPTGQRASVSNQTKSQSRSHSARYQPYNGFPSTSEHRQLKTTHGTHHLPMTLSKTPAFRHNQFQQAEAVPRQTTFSASSSGFLGLPWQTANDASSMQHYGPVYTDGADPNAFLTTSYPSDLTSSFGSDYSENSVEAGLSLSNTVEASQSQMQAYQQALPADTQQRYTTCIASNFDDLTIQPDPSEYIFPSGYQMGMGIYPYSQEHYH